MATKHGSKKGMVTFCPACGSDMHFRRLPTRGSTVTCRQCQSLLEVARLAPLTLEWAFEDPFDDDDYSNGDYRMRGKQPGIDDFDPMPDDSDDEWDEGWDDDDWSEDETEP
jgi:hypothetical protein